jgi:DNA-binding response OmpR family regulator
MAKILVVDDHKDFADTLKDWLEAEQHHVDAVYTSKDALGYLESFEYDILLLDWNLPEMSGVQLCKQYRASGGNAYVIMCTGMTATDSKIQGLDSGADDYIAKPFEIPELVARVRALMRRPLSYRGNVRQVGDLKIDTKSRVVTNGGAELDLKPLEFSVLEYFMQHPRQVISPETLLKRVWDSDSSASIDSVYTCINRLRKKLNDADKEAVIKTVRGYGYKLDL